MPMIINKLFTVVFLASVCIAHGAAASDPPKGDKGKTVADPNEVVAEIRGEKLTRGELEVIKKYRFRKMSEKRIIGRWKVFTVMANKLRESGEVNNEETKTVLAFLVLNAHAHAFMLVEQEKAIITEGEMRKYYDTHADSRDLHEDELVSFKIIAAKTRNELIKVRGRITMGEDFDEIMNAMAEQTRTITGLPDVNIENVAIGTLESSLGSQVRRTLPKFKIGKPVGPNEIPEGFAVFKVSKVQLGKLKPFSEARDVVREKLMEKKRPEISRRVNREAQIEAGVRPPPMPRTAPKKTKPKPRKSPTTKPAGTASD